MKKILSIVTFSLIFMCGLYLSGCDGDGGKTRLSFNEQKIEMVVTDDVKDYTITLENFKGEVSFDLSFERNIARVVGDISNLGGGKYLLQISPISSGTTKLIVTLRGTNHVLDIPVIISEELESFGLKNDLFIIKGESLNLSSTLFNFVPESTTLKNLSFELKDAESLANVVTFDETLNKLTVDSNASITEFTMVAKSEVESLAPYEFNIKVVSEINLENLKVYLYSQQENSVEQFDYLNPYTLFPFEYGEDEQGNDIILNNTITLTMNDITSFQKEIGVENINLDASTNYKVSVSADEGIVGEINNVSPIQNKSENFNFKIGASETTLLGQPYELTFRVYQADFEANFKEFKIKVHAINTPNDIRINNNRELDIVELYHNQENSQNFRFSVYPSLQGAENQNKYTYNIGVYEIDSNKVNGLSGEELKNVLNDKTNWTLTKTNNITQNLDIKYGNLSISELTKDTGNALLENLKDIDSTLTIKPIFYHSGYIIINASCINENGDVVCENKIAIKIHKGTDDFALKTEYLNGIYLSLSGGERTFTGFDYDTESIIGELIITPKNPSNIVCILEQVEGIGEPQITITPIEVGTSEYTIQTLNGRYVSLKITVVREINESEFALVIDNDKNSQISSFTYKTGDSVLTGKQYNMETLDTVVIKGKGQDLYIKDKINEYLDTNEFSYTYSLSLDAIYNKYFVIENNTHIISKEFTDDVTVLVRVKLTYNLINPLDVPFGLKPVEVEDAFNFYITCVDYIKSMNLTLSNKSKLDNVSQKSKSIEVYDKNVLSYKNQNFAEFYLYLDVVNSTQDKINHDSSLTITNFTFKADDQIRREGNYFNPIGYFYPTTYANDLPENGEEYIGKFICDIRGSISIDSFTITLIMTDETGVEFESTVTILIGKYIDVDNMYLTAPTDYIYLDSTDSYREKTIGVYILPADAMYKEIQVFVDSSTPSAIAYEIDKSGTSITFRYVSGGSGIIRIFPVSKMKTNSTRDEYGNYYYHIALRFTSADGLSPDKALKLSSYEDLINIRENLHYFVDGTINCNNKVVYIPSFSGSIRGTFEYSGSELFNTCEQMGQIINFKVANSGRNSGLFGILSGEIYNISISGTFARNWEITENYNIGILAGLNKGKIYDTNVSLYESNNVKLVTTKDTTEGINAYIGLVAGKNEQGEIKTTENAKISTFMANMTNSLTLNVEQDEDEGYFKLNAYVGGVCGHNTGIIESTEFAGILTGDFGTNVKVDITSNANFLGGICGLNENNISKVKAIGNLVNQSTGTFTGGLIARINGTLVNINENISRVRIDSYGAVAGLIGSISDSTETTNIKNNKVQAVDKGLSGLDASLLISRKGQTIYQIAPQNIDTSNIAESYVDRQLTTTYSSDLPLEYFYGDMVNTNANRTEYSNGEKFTKGTEENISAEVTNFALAVYKQAVNSQEQQNITNLIDTASVMGIAGVNALEIDLISNRSSLASLTNNGKNIFVGGTGLVTFTIKSSLNYKNQIKINLYLTNYFEKYLLFDDKDHIVDLKQVNVINEKTKNVYVGTKSSAFIYKNTPIQIAQNKEISFDILTTGALILDYGIIGQNIWFKAKQAQNGSQNIEISPILDVDGVLYKSLYNEDLHAYIFKQMLSSSEISPSSSFTVEVKTGIENISVEKSDLLAEPSNEISIDVEFDTYNENDILEIEALASNVNENGKYVDDVMLRAVRDAQNPSVIYLINVAGEKVFKLVETNGEIEQSSKHVINNYVISMIINQKNYKAYKNAKLSVKFVSQITGEFNSISIKYSAETISAILINNYSREENEDMIHASSNAFTYNEKNMLIATSNSAVGEYNILKTYVYTALSEFDYVEITMSTNTAGGYLAIGKTDENGIGTLNKNIQYTSIGGIVSLRVYRHDLVDESIIYDGEGRMIEIVIVYSLPVGMTSGTKVPINLTFYKLENETPSVCGQKDITVIAKQSNRVEFTIHDKQPETENINGINQIYTVVKGKRYALETNIVGYTDDQVIFESSHAAIANITNIDGVYYLNINNVNVNYEENDDNEYYPVYISSYGSKIENSVQTKGRVQVTELRVYDFLVEKEVFNEDVLSLRTLTSVDIRDKVVSTLALECVSYNQQVNNFIKEFKEKASYSISYNGEKIKLPTSSIIRKPEFTVNGYEIQPLNITDNAPYTVQVTYEFGYKNGKPTCEVQNLDSKIYGTKEFGIEVYINTNENLPSPIQDYNDFLAMKNDEYYILTNDIEINIDEYQSISATPKGLDGNGYTITLKGNKFLTDASDFGLFETISSGAVFKNLKILIKNKINIQVDNNYSTKGAYIGIICAKNEGVITNCSIESESEISVNILGTIAVMESSHFGAICALNNGFITNSRVVANISVGGASIGGFVSENNGKISSSYIKNSRIANTSGRSSENISTGGFVCYNNGSISMSYVEGKLSNTKIYCDFTNGEYGLSSKIIYTSSAVGGFVYKNNGDILDSYSNIPIVSSSRLAGFVGINNGSVKRAFSLSKLKQRDTLNYGFVISYDSEAVFEDCFFALEKGILNDHTHESNYNSLIVEGDSYAGVITGIEPLGIEEFNIYDDAIGANIQLKENHPFKNFVMSTDKNNVDAIWFSPYDKLLVNDVVSLKQSYLMEVEDLSYYDANSKEIVKQNFMARVLQLSSPNIISSARQNLNVSENDSTYYYTTDDSKVEYGSKYNPYIITSAQDLETYANQRTNSYEYYRLVCDIDYEKEGVYNTNLSDNILLGNFEGNNFKISNYAVNTKTSYVSSGLLSQFGKTNSMISVLKNLTFEPSYINIPNSIYVGGIAGTLSDSKVYNVHVSGKDVIIVGKNMVGGLFGRTTGVVNVVNVSSNAIAKSSQYGSTLITNKYDVLALKNGTLYKETASNRASVSYSGAIIGYVGGASTVLQAKVFEDAKTFGVVAGLYFGGVGSLSKVADLNVKLNSYNNQISAYAFGGIVAGENSGTIEDVEINEIDILNKTLFNVYPIMPVAIGGIAGIMANGKISNIKSTEGYSVIGANFTNNYGDSPISGTVYNIVNNPYVVKYVGGVVGYLTKGDISEINIYKQTDSGKLFTVNKINNTGASISETIKIDKNVGILVSGGNYVGGIVGYSGMKDTGKTTLTLINSNINVISSKSYTNIDGEELTEFLYSSYVSEAGTYLVSGLEFEKNIYFGTLVGYTEELWNKTLEVTADSINSSEATNRYKACGLNATNNELYVYLGIFGASAGYINSYNIGKIGNGTIGGSITNLTSNKYNLTTGNIIP